MSEKLIVKVGGVDMSAQFKALRLGPSGPFVIGRGDIEFEKQAGGLTITNMMPVQVYFAFNSAGAGVAARGRLFSGFVSRRTTGVIATTKTWVLSCQDMNLLLDALVRDAAPAYAVTVTAGDFSSQIQQVVQIVQHNGTGAVNTAIDASTYVPNLVVTSMPALHLEPGHTLRYYIQKVCDSAVAITPALKPRFYMGTSDTFGVGDVFGVPSLRLWDAALTPAADWTYTVEGGVYGDPKRSTESTQLTQRQQAVYGEGAIATYAETASVATYPNPYINHLQAPGGNSGYWMREPIKDTQSANGTQALAALTKIVQAKAYPRETITFSVYDRVRPGDIVDLTWTLEGIAGEIKRVMGVTYAYEEVGVIYATVTLNARKLQLFESGDDGIDAPPTEGDIVPPDPPTSVAVDSGTYDPLSGTARHVVTWAASESPDGVGYWLYRSQGSINYAPINIPGLTTVTTTVPFVPGIAYSLYLKSYDSANPPNLSTSSNVVTGTAAEPAPSTTIYNPGFEIASLYDVTQADGWVKTIGGGGTVALDKINKHFGTQGLALDSTSGTGGTSSLVTSRYVRAYDGMRHRFSLWAKSSFAASCMRIRVTWYTAALAAISTTTLGTGVATSTSWAEFGYYAVAPANTYAMKVDIANTVAGGKVLYIDDVKAEPHVPTTEIYNPNFDIHDPTDPTKPDGWTMDNGSGTVSWVVVASNGAHAIKFQMPSGAVPSSITSEPFLVDDQRVYFLSAAVKASTSDVTGIGIVLTFYDENLAAVGGPTTSSFGTLTTSWARNETFGGIAPSTGAHYATLTLRFGGAARAVDLYIDSLLWTSQIPTEQIKGLAITGAKMETLSPSPAGTVLMPTVTLDSKGRTTTAVARAGTAFPGSPSANDFFYRTDLGVMCQYVSGAGWLGPRLSQSLIGSANSGGVEAAYTATTLIGRFAPLSPHNYWIEDVTWSYYVATTNNALNFWTFRFGVENTGGGGAGLCDISSSAIAADTRVAREMTTFTTNPLDFSSASAFDMFLEVRKDTGLPGTLHLYGVSLIARRVYT